jgi:pyridoxal biosynthesis lyase PdxS
MSARKTAEPSPESIARFNRKRLAAEEGARALLDVERQGTDIRKNMARLRDLRETKEAADAVLLASLPAPVPKKRRSKLER